MAERLSELGIVLPPVFGPAEAGRHARSAVGMAELPMGISVEIELIARVR